MLFWLKLFLTPTLIGLVTLAVRRWGASVGGLLSGLPVVAGPISLFLALGNGIDFAANAAIGSLMGAIGIGSFCLVYVNLSLRKYHWGWCLFAAYLANTSTLFALSHLPSNLYLAVFLVVAVTLFSLWIFPKLPQKLPSRKAPKFDIPIRMIVAGLFVIGLVQISNFLGPRWSGLLTPFPILTPILAVFTHIQQGAESSAAALRGLILGSFGFIVFFFLIGLLLPATGLIVAYSIAISAGVIVNLSIIKLAQTR